jgi:hypothetical protein
MFPSRLPILAVAAILSLAALIYWFGVRSPHPTAEAALAAFYGGESRPECLLTQPLQQHGSSVVPLIIRDLPNRTMPRRRYAIGFLGEGRYREALPVLEHIFSDTTEIYYFRADALIAMFEIAPARAQELASQVVLPSHDEYRLFERAVKAVERGDVAEFVNRGCS